VLSDIDSTLDSTTWQVIETIDSQANILVSNLWSLLHEEWRKTRLNDDWTYEPRWKKVKDKTFNKEESMLIRLNSDWEFEIDIANIDYSDLSNDWKYENKASAEVAIWELLKAVNKWVNINSTDFIEEASDIIHTKWLERNDWVFDKEYWNPEQAKPYSELSEEEKDKDRDVIKKAISIYE